MQAGLPVVPRRAQRRPESQAERRDGPCGTSPCAPAEERSAMGCARAPCASMTDSLRLFELSERSERCELRNAAHGASTAGCLERSGRTGAPGSPSFAYFSWRSKKSRSGRGGEAPTSSPRSTVVSFAGTRDRDCPRQCSHFLLFRQEKVTKEKATPVPTSLRWRSGQPAVLAAWAHCTTRTTHCVRSARTSAMSQFTKREVPRAAQATALLGVGTGAPGAGSHPGHRCARPG